MMHMDKFPESLANFLKSGAFYRLSEDRFRLYWGPWKENQDDFHLAFQDFFGPDLKSFQASEVQEFNQEDLRRFLEPALGTGTKLKRGLFQEPEKSSFEQSFQIIQGKIQRGEIEKAVPIVFSKSN